MHELILALPVHRLVAEADVVLGGILSALLVITGGAAMILSVYRFRGDQRAETANEGVREGLTARLAEERSEWDGWVSALSPIERKQLVKELDRHIREGQTAEPEKLRDLVRAVGRGSEQLDQLGHADRLQALTWLARLGEPVDPDRLVGSISDHPDERAAAVKLLASGEHPSARRRGTEILLADETLSVFGLDVLYRLHRSDPSVLLREGAEYCGDWNDSMTAQVLGVLSECDPTDGPFPGWVADYLVHDSPAVRSAAIAVLRRHGPVDAVDDRRETEVTSSARETDQPTALLFSRTRPHSPTAEVQEEVLTEFSAGGHG